MNRVKEAIEMLELLKNVSSIMPDGIAMENNYPIGKTITLEDVRMDSFLFVINNAIDVLSEYDTTPVRRVDEQPQRMTYQHYKEKRGE